MGKMEYKNRRMINYLKCLGIVIFFNIFCILEANAGTINANSCSQSSVQSAINAASNGDTIIVPACTATWSSVLTISKPITLQGAGIDQTIITLTQNCAATKYNGAIVINGHTSLNTRIWGFTFNCPGGCAIMVAGAYNNTGKVRLDHLKDGASINNFIRWTNNHPGLIDNNILPGSGSSEKISIFGNGETDWASADNLGSANLLSVETAT